MPLTDQEALTVAQFLLAQYEAEIATTRRVIAAVPAGGEQYAPDGRSMNALKLAWHIASADQWFLDSIVAGAFQAGESGMPEGIRSAADVLAWFDSNVPASLDRAKALTGGQWARTIDFLGMGQAQAVSFLAVGLKHGIHHRGQLSAYLRPMGGKVPGIYGPSGDN